MNEIMNTSEATQEVRCVACDTLVAYECINEYSCEYGHNVICKTCKEKKIDFESEGGY